MRSIALASIVAEPESMEQCRNDADEICQAAQSMKHPESLVDSLHLVRDLIQDKQSHVRLGIARGTTERSNSRLR